MRDRAEVFIASPLPLSLFLPVTHPLDTNFFSPQPCAAVKSNMAAKSFTKIILSTRPRKLRLLCRLIIADYYGSPLVDVNLIFTKHRNATSCHEKRKMPVLNITIASFLDAGSDALLPVGFTLVRGEGRGEKNFHQVGIILFSSSGDYRFFF